MAAYYPEHPTEEQQAAARAFVDSLSKLYPCWYCAQHLREHLEQEPVT